jgi:hypothetical protein
MNMSVLDGKHILTVDDEPDVLVTLQQEIADECREATTSPITL